VRPERAGRKGTSVLLVPYTKRRRAEMLFQSASIDAEWSGPPTAEEIRLRDQTRLIDDPVLAETASEEELVLARRLLENRSAEEVAAALVRMHRSRLPEPEELIEDVGGGGRDRNQRDVREPRGPRVDRLTPSEYGAGGDSAWFRLPVGRAKNADPKWLLPLICRLGHVTKKDIGQIRIFDRETKFEITREAEQRFLKAIKAAGDAGDIRIEPAGAPGAKDAPSGPRPHRGPPKGAPSGPRPPHRGPPLHKKNKPQRKANG
jgi:ATP-dependent RNA helicase DeaD